MNIKKVINIYNLEELKNLNRSEVFFLVNALKIHPAFSVTKTTIKFVAVILVFLLVKKLLKINIVLTKN